MKNYLEMIGLLHKELGLPDLRSDNWFIKSFLTGMKQNLPINLDVLKGNFGGINLHINFDASFWALFYCFPGTFRKFHLLHLADAKYNPDKQFSRASIQIFAWGAVLKSNRAKFRECIGQFLFFYPWFHILSSIYPSQSNVIYYFCNPISTGLFKLM